MTTWKKASRWATTAICCALVPNVGQAADLVTPNEVDTAPPVQTGPAFTLGVSVVPLTFDLPDIALNATSVDGSIPSSLDGEVDGVGYAVSLGGEIGSLGGVPVFLAVGGAFATADARVGSLASLSGNGTITFGSDPARAGDITVSTAVTPAGATATSTVSVTDAAGGTANINQVTFSPSGANATNNVAASGTGGGAFAFTNVVTDGAGPSAAATGLASDGDGFLLVATGDLSGIGVSSTATQDVDYRELEARFFTALPIGSSGWIATPSVSPTYRYLRRDIETSAGLLLPANPIFGTRASVTADTSDELTAHYAGGSLGIGATGPVPGGLLLSLNADAGLLGMFADYEGTSSTNVTGIGVGTTRIASAAASDDLDELAYFARASVGVTRQLGGFSISVGGQAEYLSDVPMLVRNPRVGFDPAGMAAATAGDDSVRIATDDAVILSGSLSVTMAF